MILARAPLRISIAGGGTDLPSYYEKFGGFWISAAINKYIFIGINRTFTKDYVLRYSSSERVTDVADIKHNIIREVLRLHDVPPVEVVSLADIPAGTGLGSSGTFGVCLLRAIHALKRSHAAPQTLAEKAFDIEMRLLGQPVGKQDQYIAAVGGITCFDVERDGTVTTHPLTLSDKTLKRLEDNLLMFFTGYSRTSEVILSDQKKRSEAGDTEMFENLHFIRELASEIKDALTGDAPEKFGECMNRHWIRKRERSQGMSNPQIDEWYSLAMRNGAVGGKLVGAGGGGFLLFYADDAEKLRGAMSAAGLEEVGFTFDFDGATVVARD